jgi:quercetin dioxygenase-like cupin family protein
MTQKIRRVVTGHDAKGRSVVLSDGEARVHPLGRPGMSLGDIWATSAYPPMIAPAEPDPIGEELDFTIKDRGTRFRILESTPGTGEPEPWMHRTNTIDYAYVIEGEMCLILDDGVEVVLRQGDTVVQRGTNHAWVNRSGRKCRMLFVMMGAEFAPELENVELFSPDALKETITAGSD